MKDWFLAERGITADTLEAFGVKVAGDTAYFPYGKDVWKVRKQAADGSRSFRFDGDFQPALFLSPGAGSDAAFLTEGETDAMRLWQELGGDFPVAALSGINGWRDDFSEQFDGYERVYVVLDNDQDYNVSATVEKTWQEIRRALGGKAMRLKLPRSVKDVCEFFSTFNVDGFILLCEAAQRGEIHYTALDLSKDPPPIEWLVHGLIAAGDVAVMIGEPNVGKSWLSLALAAHVANGKGTWLGHRVEKQGRVLYVDEENPEDVVRDRLRKLGLDASNSDSIRYLHQQGVRLDKYPDKIMDEAMAFAPTLIVLDSLTRLHTQDENNAGAVSALFNDGINPLSRQTGATVLLLHHVNKTDSGSAFIRARGSSDISGSVDTGLDVRRAGGDSLHVVHFKSRRRSAGEVKQVKILDTPDGLVDIQTSNPVL